MLGRSIRAAYQARLLTSSRAGRSAAWMRCDLCGSCSGDLKGLQTAIDRHEASVLQLHTHTSPPSATEHAFPANTASTSAATDGPVTAIQSASSASYSTASDALWVAGASQVPDGDGANGNASGATMAPTLLPPKTPAVDAYSKTFYKRSLPSPPATAFSSAAGECRCYRLRLVALHTVRPVDTHLAQCCPTQLSSQCISEFVPI